MMDMFLYETKAVAFRTQEIKGAHYLNLSIVLRGGETTEITLCSDKPIVLEGPIGNLFEWKCAAAEAERSKERGMA